MEETGKWNLKNELKEKILSEGGEAIVLNQQFGENLAAVRIAVFDPFLFTKQFCDRQIKWRTHLISGLFLSIYFYFEFVKILKLRRICAEVTQIGKGSEIIKGN